MEQNKLVLPKVGWLNVGILSWTHFVGDFYCNILPVMLPILALQFGLSYSQCGLLYMIFQITASFLQAPIGLYADKKNLGFILPLSILLGGVLASAVGLCSTPLMLAVIVFFSGISASGFHPISGGVVPYVSPKGKSVLATSFFIMGGNIGFAVGPYITAIYLEYFTNQELIYLAIIPIITTLIILKRRVYLKPTVQNSNALNLHKILACKDFIVLVASIGFRAIPYCAFVVYIPLLYTSKGISSVTSASILMTMLLGTALGGLLVGSFALRYSLKKIITVSYVITLLALIVFLLKSDASLISYISVFIAGAAMYGSTPAAIVWAQKLLPKADSFATSMMLGFTFGIGYALSVLIGVVADFIGLHYALELFTFPTLVLAIILIVKVKEPK